MRLRAPPPAHTAQGRQARSGPAAGRERAAASSVGGERPPPPGPALSAPAGRAAAKGEEAVPGSSTRGQPRRLSERGRSRAPAAPSPSWTSGSGPGTTRACTYFSRQGRGTGADKDQTKPIPGLRWAGVTQARDPTGNQPNPSPCSRHAESCCSHASWRTTYPTLRSARGITNRPVTRREQPAP